MRIQDAKREIERSLGRRVNVIDHGRIDPNVLAMTTEDTLEVSGVKQTSVRLTTWSGDKQTHQAILSTVNER
jgi:hypothetical protein